MAPSRNNLKEDTLMNLTPLHNPMWESAYDVPSLCRSQCAKI